MSLNEFWKTRNETQHTSSHFAAVSDASSASLAALRMLRTSSQNKSFPSRNRCRTSKVLGVPVGIVSTRCLCHDLQEYCNGLSICSSALSFRSTTSELMTPSGSLQMFRSNPRFISSRQPTKSSVCWCAGQTRNLELTHRAGSRMKSGKDLWKGRTG